MSLAALYSFLEVNLMNKNRQDGFSLIELMLVIVILSVISSLAVPALMRAKDSAENQSAFSTLRAISTNEVRFYSQNNRFARLDEINAAQNNALGTITGNTLVSGRFVYEMDPIGGTPTNEDLKDGYKITATRQTSGAETPYVIYVDQTGKITQVMP